MERQSTKLLSKGGARILIVVTAVVYLAYLFSATPTIKETLWVAKNNPPFGMEGVDLERLSREVQKLERAIPPLADIYGEPADKKIIMRALHPLAFLKMLPALEESRRAFTADPSPLRSAVYRRNLKLAARAYETDIAAWRAALLALPRESKKRDEVYHFINTITSLDRLIEVSDLLLANARRLKDEIRAGKTAEVLPVEVRFASYGEPPLSESDKKNLAFVRRFVKARGGWEITSPAFEVPTDCFGAAGEQDFFYAVTLRNEIVPMYFKPAYFYYRGARFSDSRYYEPLRKEGFDYYWQPDFNLYMCPDLAYQAEVMTLYKVRTMLKQWNERGGEADGGVSETSAVEDAIRRFLAQDPLRRSTQLEFFRSAEILFARYQGGELEKIVGEENARILSEIRRLELQKTGFFEELVARGARLAGNLPELMRRLPEPLAVKELFIMRSYPSLYFTPFNSSVWRGGAPLDFIESVERSRYYHNREEFDQPYSEEELIKLMFISANLIQR